MVPRMKLLVLQHAKKVIMGLLFIAITSAFCFTAYAATNKTITIDVNGKQMKESTHLKTVAEVLKERGITPTAHDVVTPGLQQVVKDGMTIKWLPAIHVQVKDNGKTQFVWTTEKTVGDFLSQEGLTVGKHDAVSPTPDTPLTKDLVIQIKKGIQVTLDVGGKSQKVWTTPTTVKSLLTLHNITLGKQDIVKPGLQTQVSEGTTISVTRVTTKQKVVKESVDYKVVNRTDTNLEKGQTRVVQQGKKGEEAKTYLATYHNGKQVKRDLVKTEMLQVPQNEIVDHGSKVVSHSYSTSRSLDNKGNEMTVLATAYTAHCRGCSGVTATGINLIDHPGAKVIAVDPSLIPLGTKVYVDGYGYAVAADVGSAIKGHHIDLFFSSHADARRWGRQYIRIRILS